MLSLIVLLPFQLSQILAVIQQHVDQLGVPIRPGNNVYFIHPQSGTYLADMVQFDPLLRDRDLLFVSRGAPLDLKLICNNWPDATRIRSRAAFEQWYLGPVDRRLPTGGSEAKRFLVKPQ